MKAEQISVFLENRAGQLVKIIQLLAEVKINIRALSLADTSEFGILRMLVSDPIMTGAVLRQNGFTIGTASVLAVELSDKPGSLYEILRLVSSHGINVEYMYACARRHHELAVMIFRFDKIDEAQELLLANGYALVSGKELWEI